MLTVKNYFLKANKEEIMQLIIEYLSKFIFSNKKMTISKFYNTCVKEAENYYNYFINLKPEINKDNEIKIVYLDYSYYTSCLRPDITISYLPFVYLKDIKENNNLKNINIYNTNILKDSQKMELYVPYNSYISLLYIFKYIIQESEYINSTSELVNNSQNVKYIDFTPNKNNWCHYIKTELFIEDAEKNKIDKTIFDLEKKFSKRLKEKTFEYILNSFE